MGEPAFLGGKKSVWKVLILYHKQTKWRFHLTVFVRKRSSKTVSLSILSWIHSHICLWSLIVFQKSIYTKINISYGALLALSWHQILMSPFFKFCCLQSDAAKFNQPEINFSCVISDWLSRACLIVIGLLAAVKSEKWAHIWCQLNPWKWPQYWYWF